MGRWVSSGGTRTDAVSAIAINDIGATVTGQTTSGNFPTANALQSSSNGGVDAFVTQLNSTGTALPYSTYLGGTGDDYGYGVALGGRGGVYVTGATTSTNFITTPDAVQGSLVQGTDAFVTELFPTYGGSASLLYSSYLNVSNTSSVGYGIAADGQGNAVVAGATNTGPTYSGETAEDAFVGVFHASPSCPEGLDCVDIGNPSVGGDQVLTGSRTDGTWTVQGTGLGIGSTYDQFHYVAQDALGDGSISARLYAQASSPTGAEMGLMYRASEDPQAPYFDIVQIPNNGGTLLVYYRATQGGPTQLAGTVSATLPVYVRLTRAGTTFTAFTSPDPSSSSWIQVGSAISLSAIANTVDAGLAVAAATSTTTNAAIFDHVEIDTCPLDWSCADVGTPATSGTQSAPGNQAVNGDISSFSVQGAGTGVGGSGDQFHYLYTPLHGNGSISARASGLTSQGSRDPGAMAGVMLRLPGSDSTDVSDPLAPFFSVAVMPGDKVSVQYRATESGAVQTIGPVAGSTPVYVRADRASTTFTAYTSLDSETWTPVGSATIGSMSGDLVAGLAVTAHNASALDTGSFDDVRVDACPDNWSCGDLGTPAFPGTQNLSGGVWSIQGTGTSQSRYVWQSVSGNSGMSARLTRQVDTAPSAAAGLLYYDPTSGAFYSLDMTPNDGLVVQDRTSGTGGVTTLAFSPTATLPLYLSVARLGTTFTAATSYDNVTWTPVPGANATLSMASSIDLGFDISSATGTATSDVTFDTVDIGGSPPSSAPVGSDLTALDTHVGHYTQASGGLVDLNLYNSPAGEPGQSQWQARDTSLTPVAGTSYLSPATLPFTEQIAAASGGFGTGISAQAALTNEDGMTLSVGMTTTAPSATGTVQSNGVTYARVVQPSATPTPPASDLSMRATISGLDARVVLHSAAETGPFVLTLASTMTQQLVQDPNGAIEVTVPYSYYDSTGTATGSYTRTEYTLQPPILLDSSAAVTAPVSAGPASATVSGANTVSVSVDPGWLNDPHRVFPATLDLPIVTTYSANNTGILGTVNSCQPALPAPRTDLVVGSLGGCTYNGQVYFDLTSLPLSTTIATATLWMYAPAQTSTSVQVYSNTVPAALDPTTPPTWNNAPAYAGAGVAPGASNGHWQSWNVTSFVQGWVTNTASNAGLTLVSSGAPISLTSPLGAANEPPADAPYLDITYNPAIGVQGRNYIDNASSIYGISGSYTVNPLAQHCNQPAQPACGGLTSLYAVEHYLKGAFVRVSVSVDCNEDNPEQGPQHIPWWTGLTSNMNGTDADVVDVMGAAYSADLIPIVNFTIPNYDPKHPTPDCRKLYSPDPQYHDPHDPLTYAQHWSNQMQDFVKSLPPAWQSRFMLHTYFEIGNEQNANDVAYYGPPVANYPLGYYPAVYQAAAQGLYDALNGANGQSAGFALSNYTILTTGVTNPSVDDQIRDPNPQVKGLNTHVVASSAISATIAAGVQWFRLGFGAHPYHYTTYTNPSGSPTYWRNFYSEYGTYAFPNVILHNGYTPANDLAKMISLWTRYVRLGVTYPLPVVFTEDNWSSSPTRPIDRGNYQFCSDPTGCEGNYLADLFTWLNRNGFAPSGSYSTGFSPIRVAWYRGADRLNDILGLFTSSGSSKPFLVRTCGSTHSNDNTDSTTVDTTHRNADMKNYYNQLRYAACY